MGSNSTLTLYSIFGLALLLCAVTVGSIIRAWEMRTLISPAPPSFVSVPKTAAPKPLSGPIAINFSHNSSPSRTIKNQLSVNSIPMASAATVETATTPKWAQKTVTIAAQRRGCHLITSKILKEIGQDLSEFKCGLAHFFLHHTSASLTINENYDSDVRDDTETFFNRVVPEGMSAPWKHTLEGPDDMPAHIKSSMFGCSLTIPITNGKLNMGTWQFHGNSSACLGVAGEYGYVNTETQLPHVKW